MKKLVVHLEVKLLDDYLKLRNYRPATRRSYCSSLRRFLLWLESSGLESDLCSDHVRLYILYRYDLGREWKTVNCDYSALLKYIRDLKGLSWDVNQLPRPRTERELPRIISKESVELLISHAINLKYQTFMSLLYATGIRLGEALNIKLSDIDGDRHQIMIRLGKGGKDRYVDLPDCMLLMLRHYYRMYRPEVYLFTGQYLGRRLSARMVQRMIKLACDSSGLSQRVTAHTFRHCYATHHLENGSNLVYLKQQLGHQSLETTTKYIHLMNTHHSWEIHHPIADIKISYDKRI